jgi:purine-binding chemotaxis protein CheW
MIADHLMFRVGRELFAAELHAVEEAIDLASVTQVAAAPTTVRSVFTLRGMLVPLFSPAAALGVAPTEAATALIVRDGEDRIAIVADDVEDVITVHESEMRPIPTDSHDGGVVRGVIRRGADLVAVVDLEALIAACRGAPQAGVRHE